MPTRDETRAPRGPLPIRRAMTEIDDLARYSGALARIAASLLYEPAFGGEDMPHRATLGDVSLSLELVRRLADDIRLIAMKHGLQTPVEFADHRAELGDGFTAIGRAAAG